MTDETTQELTDFFEYIWHDTEGFVYLPIKQADGSPQGHWTTYSFSWPRQKAGVVRHALKWAADQTIDVYYAPALFSAARPLKENVLGAWVLWVDFDGNAPESWEVIDKALSIPEPTLIVQSSIPGHEHCYWQLDTFLSDRFKLEEMNRSLAYTLHADTSGWDADQILRPIHTMNRKRDMPVVVKSWA